MAVDITDTAVKEYQTTRLKEGAAIQAALISGDIVSLSGRPIRGRGQLDWLG
jgi:hypothetical protein